MGIMQEKRSAIVQQPAQTEEKKPETIRFDKMDAPADNEKENKEEKVEEKMDAPVEEPAVEEKEAESLVSQPKKRGGRPRKTTNKQK